MSTGENATSRNDVTVFPLKWHGGKHYLADRIIRLMPPHIHYVEPYFGGGQVLFRKPCEGISEVVNDLNGHLTNFWFTLQGQKTFAEMRRVIEATPFSEAEFDFTDNLYERTPNPGNVAAAAAFFIRYRQSRQGLGKDFATLSRNRTRRGMNEQVSSWLSAIEGLPEAHERLKRVVILNRDALDVIRQQDGPNTLFYLDPPYLHETRAVTNAYEFEMSKKQHEELLEVLSEIQGHFILSGYPSHVYAWVERREGWNRIDIDIDNKASAAKKKQTKTECLWMNFEPGEYYA
jgi:DNA adenine methylase